MNPKIVFLLRQLICFMLMSISFSCLPKSRITNIYTGQCDSVSVLKVTFSDIYKKPEYYDSKLIEIKGFYVGKFEQSALFQNSQTENISKGIWVNFDDADSLRDLKSGTYLFSSQSNFEKIVGKTIELRGILNLNSKGHLGEYFGEIHKICYLKIL